MRIEVESFFYKGIILQLFKGLLQFLLGIHDDGTAPNDGFMKSPGLHDQYLRAPFSPFQGQPFAIGKFNRRLSFYGLTGNDASPKRVKAMTESSALRFEDEFSTGFQMDVVVIERQMVA